MAVEDPTDRNPERTGAGPSDHRGADPWKIAFVALLVVGLFAVITWVLLGSRMLVVRQIEIDGLDRITYDEVVAAAAVTPGTPLARVDADAVKERVEELRLAETVEVSRGWPATLVIQVVERAPVAGVQVEHGYLLVDREGVRIEDSDTRPPGYPLVRIEGEIEGNPAIAEAARVVQGLPESIADGVDVVEATDRATITLELVDGASVVWGDAERGVDKARALEVLMEKHPPEAGRRYDVSAMGVAVVK